MDTSLYQNDPRWKNQKIGLQNKITIEQVGCMLTCFAMTVNHFGANETPASLNARMKAANGFNGAWIKGAQVPPQFPQTGVERQYHVECNGQPAPLDLIDQGLAEGSLVMVRVDWTPDANIDSHWVVIHGKRGDDYDIWDPWQKSGAPDTLQGRYGYGRKKPAEIILEAIWHGRGKFPKEQSKPAEPPPLQSKRDAVEAVQNRVLSVQPTVAQLTLRRQPVITQSNVIKSLTPGDVLVVQEAYQAGKAKIGQQGQWLEVQDSHGAQGYVAAWLVKQVAGDTAVSPPPAAVSPPPTTQLQVKPTTSSLSFRSQPVVATNTYIRTISASETLTVIESGDAAAKIGQKDQWLQVKAGDGTTGYVAAWYVTKV